jgi:uncharacterized cupredoxin-like copper-binding protein
MLGAAVGMLAVMLLLATACGGDDDADDGGATATAPSETVADGETPSGDETPGGPTSTTGPTTELSAVLTNTPFSITLSQDTAPAGRQVIAVSNEGSVGHNFWIIDTDLSADDLPVTNNVVDTEALDVVVNSGIATDGEDIQPGGQIEVQASLDPGTYVIICNVPDHYTAGMQAELTVQ